MSEHWIILDIDTYGRMLFDLGFTARQDYVTHFEPSQWDIPEKKHLTTRKQNLACLTCDPR